MTAEERRGEFFDFLSTVHFGLYALEAVTMPEAVNELGTENASAAAAFILEALRQELDQAEIRARREGSAENGKTRKR